RARHRLLTRRDLDRGVGGVVRLGAAMTAETRRFSDEECEQDEPHALAAEQAAYRRARTSKPRWGGVRTVGPRPRRRRAPVGARLQGDRCCNATTKAIPLAV